MCQRELHVTARHGKNRPIGPSSTTAAFSEVSLIPTIFLFQVASQTRRRRRDCSARTHPIGPLPAAARGHEAHHHGARPRHGRGLEAQNRISVRQEEWTPEKAAEAVLLAGGGSRVARGDHHVRRGGVVLPEVGAEAAGRAHRAAQHRAPRAPATVDARPGEICSCHSS